MSIGERAIDTLLRVPHEVGVDNRRRTGRVAVAGVRSSAGAIIDLSAGGARIIRRRPWPKGESRDIALSDSESACLVTAQAVWSQRVGMFRRVVGVEFHNITPEQASALAKIARRCSAPAHQPGVISP